MLEQIARRTAAASGVMAATMAVCSVIAVADPQEGAGGTLLAVLLATAACYFTALFAVAWSRRVSIRRRDTLFGMMAPAMGYAAAIPASIAVPLLVIDAAAGSIGAAAPLLALLCGMASVLALMVMARTLELRIDPMADASAYGGNETARGTVPVRKLEDMP